ncbi:MAG: hypothetical protein ACD_76C00077G0006 [uncultured bacterium]|nr:MAG: hypothetical protein ACD_76C00077G0006 [uncultured bacterium]
MQDGGAEKVLRELQEIWPSAPTYTLLFNQEAVSDFFKKKDIRTSFLQKAPFAMSKYQWYLPLMPLATEGYNLSNYDIVISSSSAFSKGAITNEHTVHICYCHTPTRYLWSDTHEYLKELAISRAIKPFIRPVLSYLRMWDKSAADRVDLFVANSKAVQKRIQKYYRRESIVINPPVETSRFSISDKPKNYFLAGGRIVGYKRLDIVIEAFNHLGIPLKIFGDGPLRELYSDKSSSNIEFLGKVSDKEQADLYANCIAYINPQEEDFGITPVEAMASGRPVIAYARGGALETIIEGKTGVFLHEQSWEELADAVMRFDESVFDPATIQSHAKQFDTEAFRSNMQRIVSEYATKNKI